MSAQKKSKVMLSTHFLPISLKLSVYRHIGMYSFLVLVCACACACVCVWGGISSEVHFNNLDTSYIYIEGLNFVFFGDISYLMLSLSTANVT
jgi:hypothetical protein